MRSIFLTTALLIAGCSSQQVPVGDRWHQLAAESDRLTSTFRGTLWEQQMLPMHNQFWGKVVETCGPEAKAAGITRFKAVAVINSAGLVTEYLPNPDKPALHCFATQMVGRKYPPPPETPFYEVYAVDLIPSG